MRKARALAVLSFGFLVVALTFCSGGGGAQLGVATIRAEDMKFHQKFLSAEEFRGRLAPSSELDIASKYIAMTAERIGLKPLMPNGSFYQEVPVDVTSVVEGGSRLALTSGALERVFHYPQSFAPGRTAASGKAAGEAVFVGYGLSAPELPWDDYAGLDLKGKVAIILDVSLPNDHRLKPNENRRRLAARGTAAREKGASAVVTIINEEREDRLAQNGLPFDPSERLTFPDVVTGPGAIPSKTTVSGSPATAAAPFFQADVRRDVGAAILGVDRAELDRLDAEIKAGRRVAGRRLPGKRLDLQVETATRHEKTLNVVAVLEGSDPALRGEFIAISSHHDHLGVRGGKVMPGSDDNISGVVGMFEIAEAMMTARPKRSVIFVWNTAEERGLIGSYYFVQHCPVPVEKISANLDLDMISRNDPNQIYLIGSNKLSSELDESIRTNNARSVGLTLDYKYEDPKHPDQFFFRSDQYPYIRYGIPGVWFFCGTTEDYHTANDVEAKVDYSKMVKVTKLVYLVAMDIGDRPALLKLDLMPEVKSRGEENMKVAWR